jgi:hypothetical protein
MLTRNKNLPRSIRKKDKIYFLRVWRFEEEIYPTMTSYY